MPMAVPLPGAACGSARSMKYSAAVMLLLPLPTSLAVPPRATPTIPPLGFGDRVRAGGSQTGVVGAEHQVVLAPVAGAVLAALRRLCAGWPGETPALWR